MGLSHCMKTLLLALPLITLSAFAPRAEAHTVNHPVYGQNAYHKHGHGHKHGRRHHHCHGYGRHHGVYHNFSHCHGHKHNYKPGHKHGHRPIIVPFIEFHF